MTALAENEAVNTLFNEGMEGVASIAYQNKAFTPEPKESWVRLTVLEGDSNQVEIGDPAKYHRRSGIIMVNVFTARDIGDGAAREICDSVMALFRNKTAAFDSGLVRFRSPSKRVVQSSNDAYFQMNVSIPYFTDETFTTS